jgi:predicted nuclease of predicted toxin-antitoxin system
VPVRLLFDENLAARLVRDVADLYPNSSHVTDHLPEGVSDDAIWELARAMGYVIVSKDEDFQQFSVWRGAPPKVIWIRLGNCSTSDVRALLRRSIDLIERFAMHEDATFLALA